MSYGGVSTAHSACRMATEDDGHDSTAAHPVEDMAAEGTHLVVMEVGHRPTAAGLLRDLEGSLLLQLRAHLPVLTHSASQYLSGAEQLLMSCCRLWNWFAAVDTDRSGHISAPELRMCFV